MVSLFSASRSGSSLSGQSKPFLTEDAFESKLQKVFGELGEQVLREVRQELRTGLEDIKSAVGEAMLREDVTSPQEARSSIQDANNEAAVSGKVLSWSLNNDIFKDDGFGSDGYRRLTSSDSEDNGAETASNDPSHRQKRTFTSHRTDAQEVMEIKRFGGRCRSRSLSQLGGAEGESGLSARLVRIVMDHRFEPAAGIVVLCNVILLGVEAQIRSSFDSHPPPAYKAAMEVSEFIFMCIFLVEWCLRIHVEGYHFLCASGTGTFWNWFDTFIVCMQVVDQCVELAWAQVSHLGVVKVVQVMRLFRLLRILRVLRLLHLFDELDMLLRSIALSASALMWALFLMAVMVYAFAVFFVSRTLQITNGHLSDRLAHYFGGVPRTSLTLLECLLGGISWDQPVSYLLEEVGWLSATIFVVYVAIGMFVLLNVATGVFIDKAMKSADQEVDIKIAENLATAFGLTGLKERDKEVKRSEFSEKLQDPSMVEYLQQVNIDSEHIDKFYNLLDADGSGSLDFNEVVSGCVRLRAHARAVDVALLAQDQKEMNAIIEKHLCDQEQMNERIERHMVFVEQTHGGMPLQFKSGKSSSKNSKKGSSRGSSCLPSKPLAKKNPPVRIPL